MNLDGPQWTQQKLFDTTDEDRRAAVLRSSDEDAAVHQQMQRDLSKGPVIHMWPRDATKVADSGFYANQHHTGTSNGGYMPTIRKRAEADYGFTHPIYAGIGRDDYVAASYGDIRAHVHPKYRESTTVTGRDTLNAWGEERDGPWARGGEIPQPTALKRAIEYPHEIDPDPTEYDEYMEAQISTRNGKIPLSDMTRVEVPGDSAYSTWKESPYDEAADALESRGVPVERFSHARQGYLPGMGVLMGNHHVTGEPVYRTEDFNSRGTLVESNRDYNKRREQEHLATRRDRVRR